ncbi:hypothetical protein [Algicella marina]|uniref:Uncharacterized protein n=1 Tax=Algicella marina TaxID=2683284 RepID=A0A6P1T4L4_9RHOB|nr:hypothetical protein [Algicella marina]QHQ36685.1 hypothetical protein GO499_16650 [Algicella marina]
MAFNFSQAFLELLGNVAKEKLSEKAGVHGTGLDWFLKISEHLLYERGEVQLVLSGDKSKDRFLNQDPVSILSQYHAERPIHPGLPYVEVVDFVKPWLEKGSVSIKIEPKAEAFALERFASPNTRALQKEALQRMQEVKRMTRDSRTVRLSGWHGEPSNIVLQIQQAAYSQQVQSNLVLDYAGDGKLGASLRELLIDEFGGRLPGLDDRRLVNSLGVAILVFFWDTDAKGHGHWAPFWVPRTRDTAVFNYAEWHCSASGAAEWPLPDDRTPETFEDYILDDLWNELEEEIGLYPEDFSERIVGSPLIPMALCREMIRGGKPQLFFAGFVNIGRQALVERMNDARLKLARKRKQMNTPEPIEVFPYPKFMTPKVFGDPDSVAVGYQDAQFTSEGAACLYYAYRLLGGLRERISNHGGKNDEG